jgi:hypothetical protein
LEQLDPQILGLNKVNYLFKLDMSNILSFPIIDLYWPMTNMLKNCSHRYLSKMSKMMNSMEQLDVFFKQPFTVKLFSMIPPMATYPFKYVDFHLQVMWL